MLQKPQSCSGCALESLGTGFSYPEGYCTNGVLIVGEALGANEAMEGLPFRPHADAGSLLERAIIQLGHHRSQFGIYNIVACQPPANSLTGEPYEIPAISHCTTQHLAQVYNHYNRPKVILALGAVAARTLSGLSGDRLGLDLVRGFSLPPSSSSAPWLDPETVIVPTYHPAFISRGNHALLLCFLRDMAYAIELAQDPLKRLKAREYKPDYYRQANHFQLQNLLTWLRNNPSHPLSYDFETNYEEGKKVSYEQPITQVNFSLGPQQAIVADYTGQTKGVIQDILSCTPNPKYGHNVYHFDNRVSLFNGFEVRGSRIDDTLCSFHWIYPDLPGSKGGADTKSKAEQDEDGALAPLQFCASFYGFPFPWKHLFKIDPHTYGAYDADSAAWVLNGTFADMNRLGLFQGYDTFIVELRKELEQMERRGIPGNYEHFQRLSHDIGLDIARCHNKIQITVPNDLKSMKAHKAVPAPVKALAKERGVILPKLDLIKGTFEEVAAGIDDNVLDLPAMTDFLASVSDLQAFNKAGKPTSLGYRIERFEHYNQPCLCLNKTFAPIENAVVSCDHCNGGGLLHGATKTVACVCKTSAKGDCPACQGKGQTLKKLTKKQALLLETLSQEELFDDPTKEEAKQEALTKLYKACSCVKKPSSDCSLCSGTGKVKEYTEKPCKCRVRMNPQPSCSLCMGSGLFTGAMFRWGSIQPFNVSSPKQMMAYAQKRGIRVPMNSKRKIAMDKETIKKLAKSTGDPLFLEAVELREYQKMKSAYADSWVERLKAHGSQTTIVEEKEDS